MWKHHTNYVSIRPDKVYFTWAEAKKIVDQNITEFMRQTELSDYEWSVEKIDETLAHYKNLTGASDEEVKQYTFSGDLKKYDDFDKIIRMLEEVSGIKISIKENCVVIGTK